MVEVLLFAAIRDAAGTGSVSVPPGVLRDVLDALRARFGQPFAELLAICTVLVDGEAVPHDGTNEIPDGAELAILPPVSGGSVSTTGPAEVSDEMWMERRPEVSVARALGSSTRAKIYEHLQRRDGGVAVREIAAQFGLHPNVSRTHLETLADAGLVLVGQRRRAAGGRPAKLYRARGDARVIRREDAFGGDGAGLLVDILTALAERSTPASTEELAVAAAEIAHVEGWRLGALARATMQPPDDLEEAVGRAVATLTQHAPGVRLLHIEADVVHLTAPQGVFLALRERRDQLAVAIERGLLTGLVAALAGPVDVLAGESLPDGVAVWRIRRATQAVQRQVPIAEVDTRDRTREAGVLQAVAAIAALDVGAILEVLAEGPGSPAAFARWVDRAGHELLAVERVENVRGRRAIRLLIRRGA